MCSRTTAQDAESDTSADIAALEQALWRGGFNPELLEPYQRACRRREQYIAESSPDNNFRFVVVIPVADRPLHLEQCINSIKELCRIFAYGGCVDGRYPWISVLVADDSTGMENIRAHRRLCASLKDRGVDCEYFGLEQQALLVSRLPETLYEQMHGVLGDWRHPDGIRVSGHKGAARMRNLASLRLLQLYDDANTLFHFIDSDQEFCVRVPLDEGSADVYALNYYRVLNDIFQGTDVQVLTGKVVGDPPVSPTVMAANMASDGAALLEQLKSVDPGDDCSFHQGMLDRSLDAGYHDMAHLFGFSHSADRDEAHRCTLYGRHTHRDSLSAFAERLNGFFYGAHPTRAGFFGYQGPLTETTVARTVYTGNYVLRPEMLRYFNPFAGLGLRMLGPALGRVLLDELGAQFVSANLPMLHARTLSSTGKSEFRPGVDDRSEIVSLFGEFQRQFYGDIMLFSIARLSVMDATGEQINRVVTDTARQMREEYLQQHQQIEAALDRLKGAFSDPLAWWQTDAGLARERNELQQFIDTLEANFGAECDAHDLLQDRGRQGEQIERIINAIANYPSERRDWEALLRSL